MNGEWMTKDEAMALLERLDYLTREEMFERITLGANAPDTIDTLIDKLRIRKQVLDAMTSTQSE